MAVARVSSTALSREDGLSRAAYSKEPAQRLGRLFGLSPHPADADIGRVELCEAIYLVIVSV
jgi:hypothetical protein